MIYPGDINTSVDNDINLSIARFIDELNTHMVPLCTEHSDQCEQKRRLILHVGTPKTGTTSVQTYLSKKQRKLRGKGILYPHNLDKLQNTSAPKHQWFEKNLLSHNLISFTQNWKNLVSQISPSTHTVILSSEGIYNYWWDFSEHAQLILKALQDVFDVSIWVWFREPLGFIDSYYKQCIRNPQVSSNPCYGTDKSLDDMLDMPWFANHLRYQDFIDDCHALFSKSSVLAFEYKGDVVKTVSQKLGLATAHDNPTPRQNSSLNQITTNLLRVINQQNIKAKDKTEIMHHLTQVNSLLEAYDDKDELEIEIKNKVFSLYRPVKHFTFEQDS